MRQRLIAFQYAIASISLVLLAACGGGGGGSSNGGNTPIGVFAGLDSFGNGLGSDGGSAGLGGGDAGADGTGGEGKPFPFAAVTLTDAAGKSVTAKTNAAGYYQAKITGFAAPLVASATAGSKTYYSFTTIAPKADGFITINITGLTDKLASDVAAAAGKTSSSAITPAIIAANPKAVEAAYTSLRAVLSAQLSANSLNVATFDPVTLPFLTNGKGYDAVLDTTLVTKTGTGTTQITPNGQALAPGLDTSGIAVFVNEFNRLAASAAGIASADFANVWDTAYLDGTFNQTSRVAGIRAVGRTYAIVLPSFYDCVAATGVCKFNATITFKSISSGSTGTFNLLADSVKLTAGVWRQHGSQDASRQSSVGGGSLSSGSSTTVASTPMYASGNIPVNVNASNFAAFSGSSLSFPSGVPQFGTTGATQLTLGTSSGSPTFAITSASGNASGSLGFSSCIFNVTTSTFPASATMASGNTVTIPTCSVNLPLAGVQAGTGFSNFSAQFNLGTATPSVFPVALNLSTNGQVTINGVAVVTAVLTSNSGSGGGTSVVAPPAPIPPPVSVLSQYQVTQNANQQTTYYPNLPSSLGWRVCAASAGSDMSFYDNFASAVTGVLGGSTPVVNPGMMTFPVSTPLACTNTFSMSASFADIRANISAPAMATAGQAISATVTFANVGNITATGVYGYILPPSGVTQSFTLPSLPSGSTYTTVTTHAIPALTIGTPTVINYYTLNAPYLMGSKYKSAKIDYYGTVGAPIGSPASLFKLDTKSAMPCSGFIAIDDGNPISCSSSINMTDSFAVPFNNDFATGSVTLKITLFEGTAYSGTQTVTLQPFNQRLYTSADAANFVTVFNPASIASGAVNFTSTAALIHVSIAASKLTITAVTSFMPGGTGFITVTNTVTQVTSSVPGASWFNTVSSTTINGLNGNITLAKALAQCTATNPSNPSFCAQYTGVGNPQFTRFNTNAIDASGRQFNTSFSFPYISY